MNLTTVSSEQIISKDGELSIDIFKDCNYPDSSKLSVNCNSILNDGICFYCPHGGVSFYTKNLIFQSLFFFFCANQELCLQYRM